MSCSVGRMLSDVGLAKMAQFTVNFICDHYQCFWICSAFRSDAFLRVYTIILLDLSVKDLRYLKKPCRHSTGKEMRWVLKESQFTKNPQLYVKKSYFRYLPGHFQCSEELFFFIIMNIGCIVTADQHLESTFLRVLGHIRSRMVKSEVLQNILKFFFKGRKDE